MDEQTYRQRADAKVDGYKAEGERLAARIAATGEAWTAVTTSGDTTEFVPSETGGVKGKKQVQPSRLPQVIANVAEHFTRGSAKYPDVRPGVANWSLGYDWSLSYDALMRHLWAWWYGEDNDPETGSHHLDAVIFHALTAREFVETHPEFDDRPVRAAP